jgi:hypothetical protein
LGAKPPLDRQAERAGDCVIRCVAATHLIIKKKARAAAGQVRRNMQNIAYVVAPRNSPLAKYVVGRRLVGPRTFAYRRGRRWLTANAYVLKRRNAA